MLLEGYIDESYGKNQKNFVLSCLIGEKKSLREMRRMWKLQLAAKNKQLAREGRRPLARYHATDCNSRHSDFEGWEIEERNEFVLGLLGTFKRTELYTAAIHLDLEALCEVFPEFAAKRLAFAYVLLIDFLLYLIGDDFHHVVGSEGTLKVSLFHDRTANGKYDAAILRQFKRTISTTGFPYSDFFTTIRSLKWQDCILLQPTDLVAFEVLREAEKRSSDRQRRKSYEALLALKNFGIHVKSFAKREAILDLRRKIERRNTQFDPFESL